MRLSRSINIYREWLSSKQEELSRKQDFEFKRIS